VMVNIFWFRRDLRLDDNTALFHALKQGRPVLPLFIFDAEILKKLDDKPDPRITFIYGEITRIKNSLEKKGSSLIVKFGNPAEVFRELITTYSVGAVYTNHDYEPYARKRDREVELLLSSNQIPFISHKDQVIFEKGEVVKDSGEPYTVFTPYSRKWKLKFRETGVSVVPSVDLADNFIRMTPEKLLSLESLGFISSGLTFPSREIDTGVIREYDQTRDIPSIRGTSRLSLHLRFGTVSIRNLVKTASALNEKYLDELIWREFYMMILWYFPRVVEQSFKAQYDLLAWRNSEQDFSAWCNGQTGFPIVDAGMRELNHTGFMHNRLRMITASFLSKHLLIDWRWGEAYFAKKLLDFELSSNNGGWQWAAGTGCDAAPYFRIFNPSLQADRYDPENTYIRHWVPEFDSPQYVRPVVDHVQARNRALSEYKKALGKIY
jgi:deoxyribodipyrimidine photo-lyase